MPTKAAYLAFDDNELRFEFFLTQKLGFRTVAQMRAEMSQMEFLHWGIYYARKAQDEELAAQKAG